MELGNALNWFEIPVSDLPVQKNFMKRYSIMRCLRIKWEMYTWVSFYTM